MTVLVSEAPLPRSSDDSPRELTAHSIPLQAALCESAVRTQWAELHGSSDDAHPLLHPDAVAAWFAETDEPVATRPFVHAVLRGDRLMCLGVLDVWTLPVLPRCGWTRPARRVYAKSLIRDHSPDAEPVDRAVAFWMRSLRRLPDAEIPSTLYLEALDRNSDLCRALQQSDTGWQSLETSPPQPRWRTLLPDSVDTYWQAQHSSRTRNTLRRKRRKLPEPEFRVCSQPDDVAEFLRYASEISQHTWQSKQLGLRIKNNAAERRLYEVLAERNSFRGYLLFLESQPTAFVITTSQNGTVHYEETGYVPEVAHLSPGLLLVAEVIDDLIRAGRFCVLDFGLGHASYKEQFANQKSASEDLWLVRASVSATLATAAIQCDSRLRREARSLLDRTGLLRPLRRWRREQ